MDKLFKKQSFLKLLEHEIRNMVSLISVKEAESLTKNIH